MLRKIYQELMAIRKELQAIQGSMKSHEDLVLVRKPYSTTYEIHRTVLDEPLETDNKEPKLWRRFELLTEDDAERVRLERVLDKHTLTRQELAIILFGLRVRPEFGKKDFGI